MTSHRRGVAPDLLLPGFTTPLFAHAAASEIPKIAPLTASERIGAVISTSSRSTARHGINQARHINPATELLVDAARYAGKNRVAGTSPFDPAWIGMQRDLDLRWVLTDSGYAGTGDLASIVSILDQAQALGSRTIALLPLASSWLTTDLSLLTTCINQAGVPVAIALEHKKDPLSSAQAVRGLQAVLGCRVPVLILRCDVSALGALAHGAVAAAVGTSTGLRHIFPVVPDDKNRPIPRKTSAVVPALLGYSTLDKIERGVLADPTSPVWHCDCTVCYGRTMDWILNSATPDADAYRHSLAALAEAAHQLMGLPTRADRCTSWRAQCQHAQARHFEIEDSASAWEPAAALAAWVKAPLEPALA